MPTLFALAVAVSSCSSQSDGDTLEPTSSDTGTAPTKPPPVEDAASTTIGHDTAPPPTSIDPEVDVDDLTLPSDAVAAPEIAVLSADDFPRTIEHDFGFAEIPSPPERIYTSAGVTDIDALISLGVVPYATALYYPINTQGELGLAPWNSDYAGQVVTLPRDPAIEEVARLEPDLIVGQPGDITEDFDLYSEIAPTVVHNYPTDWQDPLILFGETLGLEAEADAAIARIQAEIDVIAERVPDDAPSVAIVTPSLGGEVVIYNENLGPGPARSLASIGIEVVGPDGPISYERIGDLADADWILVFDFTISPVDAFLEDPVFNQLPAVQRGNVVRLSPEQSFSWVIETSRSLPATLDGILTEIGL